MFCFFAINSQAQWSYKFMSHQKHFLYTSGDYMVGETNGGKLGLNYVYDNKYLVNIGYSATNKTAYPLAGEYTKSANSQSVSVAGSEGFQNIENFHLMVGRFFKLNRKNTVRLLIQGGPGVLTSRKPEYTLPGDNYTTNISQFPSLTLNPKLEFPFLYSLGFSVGPMIIVSSEQNYYGAGIGFMYGIIRR